MDRKEAAEDAKDRELQALADVVSASWEELGQIPRASFEEFVSDGRNLPASLYLLQSMVQALIKTAACCVADLGLPTPRTNEELVVLLADAKLLSDESADTFLCLARFRDDIVHAYERVDPRQVYRLISSEPEKLTRLGHELLSSRPR